MQRLIDLLGEKEKIFVELSNENLKRKFMQQAEDEGFVVNGKMPTTQNAESVMIIHDDFTLGTLVGMATHMHYHYCPKEMRIDYARYINGLEDYYINIKSN
jgi:hypothetical protein